MAQFRPQVTIDDLATAFRACEWRFEEVDRPYMNKYWVAHPEMPTEEAHDVASLEFRIEGYEVKMIVYARDRLVRTYAVEDRSGASDFCFVLQSARANRHDWFALAPIFGYIGLPKLFTSSFAT